MQTEYTISQDLQYELQRFLNNHDIALLNQNLRRLLVDFLDYELRTGVPLYFDDFFFPFNQLLDVLDTAAQELQTHAAAEKATQPQTIHKPTPTEKVIAFVKAGLNPAAIFQLHHTVDENGKQFFDLLVIIPATSNTKFTFYEQVLTLANIEDVVINASLHKEEMLQQQLHEGHMYYSIVCNRQNLIYSTTNFELPEPNKETLKALAEKATTTFNEAHKKADSFLHGAANFRGDKDNELSAFMLQQAAELIIRGLIKALSGNCPKTHCFNELKKPLKRYLPALTYIISNNDAEEERLLHILEKAYLESRYSSQLSINNADIDLLSEAIELLHERAGILFNQRLIYITSNNP